jgi:hypothetical protein
MFSSKLFAGCIVIRLLFQLKKSYFGGFVLPCIMHVCANDEVTCGWRKLHNEELHGLYSSPSIVRVSKARRMRWAGHVARMGEVRGAYNILVGRPEGRRPLGRPRRIWEDNIKVDLGK